MQSSKYYVIKSRVHHYLYLGEQWVRKPNAGGACSKLLENFVILNIFLILLYRLDIYHIHKNITYTYDI